MLRYKVFIYISLLVLCNSVLIQAAELDIIKRAASNNACKGDDFLLLLAIRKAENGSIGNEFGIMNPKARNTNLYTQAAWCACTIVKNRQRWNKRGDFIDFLGSHYCPVGASNDKQGLNKNWCSNVRYWFSKYKLMYRS